MLEKNILESTLFCNLLRIYQKFKVNQVDLNSSYNNTNSLSQDKESTTSKIMTTTIKFKAIFSTLFQSHNPMIIQKSMRHIDAFDDETNDYRVKREKNNESVRKSRAKNRVKLQECSSNVMNLKIENVQLNQKLENLQSELYTLKGLFQHCFSFNLNDLAIKPSDIPTTTLYKMIMQNKVDQAPTQTSISQVENNNQEEAVNKKLPMNEVDNFYINQIKNALSNIVSPDINKAKIVEN